MSSRLPEFIDPRRLASQGAGYSGTVELGKLGRLREALMDAAGSAEFSLEFYQDNRKRARIKGQVQAKLVLECQRCLGAMTYPVNAKLDLAVIQVPEEADLLPESCDPVWVEGDTLRLLDLVEEELILAIPQVPRHEPDACEMDSSFTVSGETADQEQKNDASDKPNPFAVLAGFKSDK
ncbi:YceD family protein [Sedimenticola sp.]|uniref:YceD family protein n=1 Tax=Sedimenticola sp. TaxID=1940285 RepID=UPI003D0B8AE3